MARRTLGIWVPIALFVAAGVNFFSGCGYEDGPALGYCDDDKNPCTIDTCASGATAHNPKPEGEACALGINAGTCNNAGLCQLDCLKPVNGTPGMCKCTDDSECPADEACATWACTMGTCTRTLKADDTVVGTLEKGDCKREICTAGTKNTVQDDEDPPEDAKGDCKKPVCSNGMPSTTNDNADEPPDTGCVDNSCLNGMPIATNALVGTACMGGVCDSKGACVDCLTALDYPSCAACSVKKCDAEPCVSSGECKTGACADGVCCDTACIEECKSCNVAGNLGVCTNIPYYQPDEKYTDSFGDPNSACSNTYLCNGMGKCLSRVGAPCGADADCMSGKCSTMANLCLGAKDEVCTSNGQCASGTCTNNKCT